MNDLDKIVFIADNVEPKKNNNFLEMIQSGEITNPNYCIKLIIRDKIRRAIHSCYYIDIE